MIQRDYISKRTSFTYYQLDGNVLGMLVLAAIVTSVIP
jgi:hypothetical protein